MRKDNKNEKTSEGDDEIRLRRGETLRKETNTN